MGLANCHQRVTVRSRNTRIRNFYIDPLSDLRPDSEASGCLDFAYVTSFTKFQILYEIYSRKVLYGLILGNHTGMPVEHALLECVHTTVLNLVR